MCVQGQNPSGHCLVARRVVAAAPLPCPPPPSRPRLRRAPGDRLGAVHVRGRPRVRALRRVLAHCASTRPDVVVLLGPFVDAEHKTIRGEDDSHPLEASFEEVFAFGVRDRLEKFLSVRGRGYAPSVVLMPSTRDARTTPCFRNLLLADGSVEAPAGVVVACAPNPGTFTVNGVRVMACTQDVLRHLSAAEAARTPRRAATAGATRRAHPGTRSAYPLYPPARDASVDAARDAFTLDVTPDVMLLPSDLNPFAKIVPREAAHAAAANAPPLAGRTRRRRTRSSPSTRDDSREGTSGGRSRACTSPRGRPNPGRAGNSRTSSPNARGSISCACRGTERGEGRGGRRGAEEILRPARKRVSSRKRRARGRERRRSTRAPSSRRRSRTPM